MTVDYSLAEQVHATAKLEDVTTVKLWLGADVMLEYDLEEAKTVLVRHLVCILLNNHKLMNPILPQRAFSPSPVTEGKRSCRGFGLSQKPLLCCCSLKRKKALCFLQGRREDCSGWSITTRAPATILGSGGF